jgi:hypothetical protein
MNLFVDMDGVLCDFDSQIRTVFKDRIEPNEDVRMFKERIGSNQFWKGIRERGESFWATMEPNDENIQEVWQRLCSKVKHIAILSSPDKKDPSSITGKNMWLDIHFGKGEPPCRLFQSDKHVHATPDSILIDDRPDLIENWKNNGGKGILFQGKFDDTFWGELDRVINVKLACKE